MYEQMESASVMSVSTVRKAIQNVRVVIICVELYVFYTPSVSTKL